MSLFNKILKKENVTNSYDDMSQQEKLDYIKTLEEDHDNKLYSQGESYYFSEEAKILGRKINELKKEYIKEFPQDYLTVGANIHQVLWSYVNGMPLGEQEILRLTGEGKYYEELGEYDNAIGYYQDAYDLTMQVLGDETQELIDENGPGEYLYTAKINQRIRVCKKAILKDKTTKLESEAKALEKTNPSEAIKIYEELNRLKPGLKKYNKRIDICKKKL